MRMLRDFLPGQRPVLARFSSSEGELRIACGLSHTMNLKESPKHYLLYELHKAVFYFMTWDEIRAPLYLDELIGALEAPKKNASVTRAANFRNFLLNYPEQNTAEDLLNDICFLYAGKKEFPEGLGNSQQLRFRICERLALLLGERYIQTFLSCPPNAKQPFVEKQMQLKGKEQQNQSRKFLFLFLLLRNGLIPLPNDLSNIIIDLFVHKGVMKPAFVYISKEKVDMVDINDEEGNAFDFVMMK